MIDNNFSIEYNKILQKKQIKEFELNQTMCSLIDNESKNDLNLNAIVIMCLIKKQVQLFLNQFKF